MSKIQTNFDKLKRYFIQLSYKGTNFCGWQIQPNAKTIQEEIQNSMSKILQQKIDIIGAGRTDTGVHANFYVAHFETDKTFEKESFLKKMNSILNKDIALQNVFEVENNIHARFDAKSRTYKYHIHFDKNPFLNDLSTFLYWKPDLYIMNKAAKILFDYEDFTSFSKLHTDVKTNNCKIYRAEWKIINENRIFFEIEADRFLRNMVRAIVGTLLEIGKKKIDIEKFKNIIEAKDRNKAGISVPAQGLYLTDIKYPEEVDKNFLRLSENK